MALAHTETQTTLMQWNNLLWATFPPARCIIKYFRCSALCPDSVFSTVDIHWKPLTLSWIDMSTSLMLRVCMYCNVNKGKKQIKWNRIKKTDYFPTCFELLFCLFIFVSLQNAKIEWRSHRKSFSLIILWTFFHNNNQKIILYCKIKRTSIFILFLFLFLCYLLILILLL